MMIRTTIIALAWAAMSNVALAQSPKSLGQFNDWTAWTYDGSKGKVCYIHATPKTLKPDNLRHGDVSFFIRTSPSEGITNEANFVVGYPFQENSTVTVDIDNRKFVMFTQGDSAWLLNATEESELLTSMRAGSRMSISGTSRRGNNTAYSISLSGVTAASAKIASECK